MVDTSLGSTGPKSTAATPQAPAAVPKSNSAPSLGKLAPFSQGNAVRSAHTSAAHSAETPPVARQSEPIVSKVSGLTTYRDHESGRLVVQIFDQKRGDVILEFPTENMLRSYPTSSSEPSIDHIVETKA